MDEAAPHTKQGAAPQEQHGDATRPGAPDELSVTWLGHATCAMRLGRALVLTDPVLGPSVGHLVRFQPLDPSLAHGIDAVVISHAHRDHLDIPSLRRLVAVRGDDLLTIYAPPGAAEVVAGARLRGRVNLLTVLPGDEATIEGARLRFTDADHEGTRYPWTRGRGHERAVGCVLERGERSIYFAGDTDIFEGIDRVGPVEVALLPVGGWWRTIGPGHLDGQRAADVARLLDARVVVPIHWGTFHPRWASRWMRDIRSNPVRLLEETLAAHGSHAAVRVLDPGGHLVVAPDEGGQGPPER